MTQRIEDKAQQSGAGVAGRYRYDQAVTLALMQKKRLWKMTRQAPTTLNSFEKSLIFGRKEK
ncbi:MAG: hypothetical protein ABFD57_02490 [Smithella sp.]